MKKRIMILVLIFICTVTMTSAFSFSYLSAASTSTYTSGGSVTGRVNKAPSNLQGSKTQIGMKKGDRYYLGKNGGSSIGWQLIGDDFLPGNVSEDSWLAMTTTPIAIIGKYNSVPTYYYYTNNTTKIPISSAFTSGVAPFESSNVYSLMNAFNTQWASYGSLGLIGTHLSTYYDNITSAFTVTTSNTYAYTMLKENCISNYYGKQAFLLHFYDIASKNVPGYGMINPAFNVPSNDLKFVYNGGGAENGYHILDAYVDTTVTNSTNYAVGNTGFLAYKPNNYNISYRYYM